MASTITFNNLSKADGSALVDQDDSIVQATVFGPVSTSRIDYEEAIVEVTSKPMDLALEDLLKRIFKEVILTRLHPRTSISIMVQQIYGSSISSAVNASFCALMDAGIPMKFPVVGVSVELGCKIDFVFDNNLDLITILTRGSIGQGDLTRAIEMGQAEARQRHNHLRESLEDKTLLMSAGL